MLKELWVIVPCSVVRCRLLALALRCRHPSSLQHLSRYEVLTALNQCVLIALNLKLSCAELPRGTQASALSLSLPTVCISAVLISRRKYYEDTKTAFYCYKYLWLNAIIFMSDKLVLIKGMKIEIVLFIKKKKKRKKKVSRFSFLSVLFYRIFDHLLNTQLIVYNFRQVWRIIMWNEVVRVQTCW